MSSFFSGIRVLTVILVLGALSPIASAAETIELQLRWHAQFQFAGYYAALEKGFYKDAGLDVVITEGQPDKKPVAQVLDGIANYGVGNSEVLLTRLQGAPLVALAAVLQHSPSVLIATKSSNIATPHDLIGKKVMIMGEQVDADFVAMFHNENIDYTQIDLTPSSYKIQDLVDGKVDVFNSYLSNEPFYLHERGIEHTVINPSLYSVDFYSDILFTTEQELDDNPERVKAFRQASMKGWRYALKHQDEIIELLMSKYLVDKSRAHLKYEATTLQQLILPDVVDLGHMNPWRWQHMADTFIDAGMVDNANKLTGFDYLALQQNHQEKWTQVGKLTALISVIAIVMLIILSCAYQRTKKEIGLRKLAEEELKQLAYTDALTGLANRHQFYTLASQALKNAARNKSLIAFCYIDVNDFKVFNDNYGHYFGDQALKQLANTLVEQTRKSDIVARLGGDEFVLILPDISSRSEAEAWVAKIKQQIELPVAFEAEMLQITVSIGLGIYPEDGQAIDKLLRVSDSEMYAEKRS